MKTAWLLGRNIPDKATLHRALAEQLDFPPYYGCNLDALYDVLTAVSEEHEIHIGDKYILREHLGGYFTLFCHALEDIHEDNPAVTVVWGE